MATPQNKPDYIGILKFLSVQGIAAPVNISPELQKMFPLSGKETNEELIQKTRDLVVFLKSLVGNVWFSDGEPQSLGLGKGKRGDDEVFVWLKERPVMAHLTSAGFSFLYAYDSQKLTDAVTKSTLHIKAFLADLRYLAHGCHFCRPVL
jgi:hypothetical protein